MTNTQIDETLSKLREKELKVINLKRNSGEKNIIFSLSREIDEGVQTLIGKITGEHIPLYSCRATLSIEAEGYIPGASMCSRPRKGMRPGEAWAKVDGFASSKEEAIASALNGKGRTAGITWRSDIDPEDDYMENRYAREPTPEAMVEAEASVKITGSAWQWGGYIWTPEEQALSLLRGKIRWYCGRYHVL